jgi:UDP-N-acetylglucosamine--N-acetylmuramyl-(pentapeptide) pyrophosphoryl-undecaprenol N-acetylglucosamine transferase
VTYAIAAAGTGGHVFPGLAVGEALMARGVRPVDILYIGGSRLEATVYPEAGFPFLSVEVRGLQRRLTAANLGIPKMVWQARGAIAAELRPRTVKVLLGMGGYVTVPAALAARRLGITYMLSEQNAESGLANRLMARLASRVFVAFQPTLGLPHGVWVGNPIRAGLANFSREDLRGQAMSRYQLQAEVPVLGVFGGSLGAGVINRAVADLAASWAGSPIQILHLAGIAHQAEFSAKAATSQICWRVVGFETEMAWFYAAADLVLARAGGAVAELTATSTPAILVPGGFGSGAHQKANAERLVAAGAAILLEEPRIRTLPAMIEELLGTTNRLTEMAAAGRVLAKPQAAAAIAEEMTTAHG